MDSTIPHLGEVFSLLAAVSWGIAVILFKKSGETVHPVALNLYKNVLAVLLFIPTMWLFKEMFIPQLCLRDYLLLLFSGAIGIGVGDTLLFKSLNLIGAGLHSIVDCLYSPSIIGLSMIFLGERLSVLQIFGAVIIISSVLLITREKRHTEVSRRNLIRGIVLGVLAVLCIAVGIVMIKPIIGRSPLLWAIEVRLLGGVLFLCLILVFNSSRRKIVSTLISARGWGYTLASSFFGAYLAMFFWLAGMKLTQASIASALNQTSNVFVFIFAAIFLKEPMNLLRIMAIIIAFAGIYMVFFG